MSESQGRPPLLRWKTSNQYPTLWMGYLGQLQLPVVVIEWYAVPPPSEKCPHVLHSQIPLNPLVTHFPDLESAQWHAEDHVAAFLGQIGATISEVSP